MRNLVQEMSHVVKDILTPIAMEAADTLTKPAVAGTVSGGTGAYLRACGVDYTSPAVFLPLFGAILSIIWAAYNIEEKIYLRRQRPK